MAAIKNFKNHSTIQIKKDIYFVFGSLENNDSPVERIKSSINEFKKYFETIGEEAPEVGMSWRTAKEGDWVLSDDFRVVQILKRTESKVDNSYNKAVIRTCVGTFAVNPKTVFDTDFELHPDRYRVSNSGKDADMRLIERKKATNNETVFARRIANGDQPEEAYMKTFPTENKRYAKDMSSLLLKQERVQKNISSEIENILAEEGVSKRYIIQQYRNLIDDGMLDLKNCSGSVRAALSDLVDIAGMKPEKSKTSTSMGVLQEVDDDVLSQVESAEFSVIENGNARELEENFEQEFLEEAEQTEVKRNFEKVGDNLLTKTGMSLLE